MKYVILMTVLLSGCATTMTKEIQGVRYLAKSDAPANCKEIGPVMAPIAFQISYKGAEYKLRQAAHDIGGNLVTYDRTQNSISYGTAFKCQ